MNHGAKLLHLRGAAGMNAIYRKVSRRLLPLLMLCYAVAFLDRVNIGYAKLQMGAALDFSEQIYAWGAGAFFIGYGLFALPCNLLLEKIGARTTLLRIMLCWGVTAMASAFVLHPVEFYALRFLLGVFEAGFFPGVILYLTRWYPAARRARVIALFASAALLAGAAAGPLCSLTLDYMSQFDSLQNWQWLLLLHGAPALLLGVAAYFTLAERPDDAAWLSPFEQQMIAQELERDEDAFHAPADEQAPPPSTAAVILSLLRDPALRLLAAANLLSMGATYTLTFWSPMLMQRWSVGSHIAPELLAAIPGIAGAIGMVLICHDSDRRHERRGHFVACMVLAAGGLGMAIAADNGLAWSLAGLALASLGIASAPPLLVAILTTLLNRRRAAAGIALVCTSGLLGGAIGPACSERVLAWGGSSAMLAALIVVYVAAGAILLLALRRAPQHGGPDAGHGHSDKIARS